MHPKVLIGIAFALMALVAFNLSNPTMHSDLGSSFNAWYSRVAPELEPGVDLKDGALTLKVSVLLKDPSRGATPSVWELPSRSLLDATDRENTARVLQLIRESGVFSLAPLRNPASVESLVSFSVKDADRLFEISVPLDAARNNIQVMNLLKLLDIYASSTETPDVTPARL
jgi:hypothetical protein